MNSAPLRFLLLAAVCLFALRGTSSRARAEEVPVVAILSETLLRTPTAGTLPGAESMKRGGLLAGQVQLALGIDSRWAFVERAALASLEREQVLAAAGFSSGDLRSGRLSHADWVLSLRLLATDLARPRLVAEVSDAFRGETLARIEADLRAVPDESWLLSPSAEAVESAAAAARRSLAAALARWESVRGRLVVAPFGFVNRTRTDRLAPLGEALRAALAVGAEPAGSQVRLLQLDAVGGTLEESLLMQAGMSDLRPGDWARVADVFLWVEFYEAEAAGTGPADAKVHVTAHTADGVVWSAVTGGSLQALPELAARVAKAVFSRMPGALADAKQGGGFTPEDRAGMAGRLIAEARKEGAVKHFRTPQDRQRFERAARLVDLAAFLAPDNRRWRELRVQMAAHLLRYDDPRRMYWADEFWRVADLFLVDADGSVDLGLLARGAAWPIAGEPERFLRIGKSLREIEPGRAGEFSGFAEHFLGTLERDSGAAGKVELFESLWPVLRPALAAPADHEPKLLGSVYARDPARGRAWFRREPPPAAAPAPVRTVSSPDPWAVFERPEPGAPETPETPAPPAAGEVTARTHPSGPGYRYPWDRPVASRPGPPEQASQVPAFQSFYLPLKFVRQDDRFVEPPSESLDNLPEMEARWLPISPGRLSRLPLNAPATIDGLAAEANGVWLIFGSEMSGGKRSVCFFDLGRHEITQPAGVVPQAASVSGFRIADGRVWMATKGEGLRVRDGVTGGVRRIDSSGGLLRDEISRIEIGRDAAFADTTAGTETSGFLARIPLDGSAPGRAEAPSDKALAGLPPAVRAAIASFAPGAVPQVRLPRVAGRSAWRAEKGTPPEEAEPQPSFCRTGPGDGYWVSDGAAVAWAAGGELREIARWDRARVQALADDGRNLFIAVSTRPFPTRSRSRGFYPGQLRIYVYDHREAAWRGHLTGAAFFEGISAIPGMLVFTVPPRTPGEAYSLLMMNTGAFSPHAKLPSPAGGKRDLFALMQAGDAAGLRAALAAGADPNAAADSGWTPLMAALWADRADLVGALLDAGARCDVADKRGWHPLFIASAWCGPGLVQLLLDRGAKPDFQAAPLPGIDRGPGPSALHAAVRAGRSPAIAALLRAGASPALRDEAGATPFVVAYREAPDAIVRQLLVGGGVDETALLQIDLTFRPGLKADLLAAAPRSQALLDRLLVEAIRRLKPGQPDLAEIRALLTEGADPFRAIVPGGSSAVGEAFAGEHFAAVALMIDHARDLNRPADPAVKDGVSPPAISLLRVALEQGQPAIARRLLDKGLVPRMEVADADGFAKPLLQLAVTHGDADIVRVLRRHEFVIPHNDMQYTSILPAAVRRKDPAVLAALLEPLAGGQAGRRDAVKDLLGYDYYVNPLFAAIEAGWPEGIGLLVAAGAERRACNRDGVTLNELVRAKPALAVAFNHRPGAPDNTLEGAEALALVTVSGGSLSPAQITPAVSAYRDFAGETVLIAAARRGDNALVRALLAAGADVKAATVSLGETALTAGILACDDATVDALLVAGAPADGPPGAEVAPLHIAAMGGSAARVKRLLAAGASPTLRTPRRGLLPVHSAAFSPGDLGALLALMETGRIDLNARDGEGFGVLEMAVTSDSPEKIQYLLDHGARWARPHDAHYHPMDVAASRGLTGTIRKLLQLGLRSPRALSLAKDDATRALLQSDEDPAARIARDDEQLWPDILRDDANWRARAEARLAAGGNVNHVSARWTTPLLVAVWQDDVERVKFLLERGADPALDPGPMSTSGETSPLFRWISKLPERRFFASDRIDKTEEETDDLAIAYIDVFWTRETDPRTRSFMVRSTFEARLPRATAHLVGLGASTRWAVDSFEKAAGLTPEERLRWAAILGIEP